MTTGWAQQSTPPVATDRSTMIKELEQLESRHLNKLNVDQQVIGDALKKALTSSRDLIELYAETVFIKRYEGAKKATSEFKKWKNSQEDIFKTDSFQTALSLHANYLYLTFLRAMGESEQKVNERLLHHIDQIWKAEDACDLRTRHTQDLLDRPVTQGLLAQRFQFKQKFTCINEQDKTWEWLPINTDGMLDKTLFPFLRTLKSPMLIQIWDKRIEHEATGAKRSGLNDRLAHFTDQKLPQLQWQRARDLILIEKEPEGLLIMIGILRQHTNLPDFLAYANELRERLTKNQTAPPTTL